MPITPGENIGPYRILEQLGSGGMATVYKAYHASLDRYVAIKVLHPAFKANPQFFERFQREARIVAKLEHPHIIPVYDFDEHHGEPYLVMRFVEGDTLKSRMKGTPMPPAEVLNLMRPVCQALSYAHNQGVLHRDIKPSNVMVAKDGSIFLTDFGLARMVQAGESTLSQDMMVGTPQYISPEQAQGVSNLDGRTDIYSLGVVLFEMVTGRVPFSADTPFATIHDHIYTPLPLPSTINPDIDPAVERMLLKALAKEPSDRFETVDELLKGLETTLGPLVAAAPTKVKTTAPAAMPADKTVVDKPKKGGMPWWVWAGSAVLILCVAGAIVAGLIRWRRNQQPPPRQVEPASVVDEGQPGQGDQPAPPPQGDQPPPGQSDQPGSPDRQKAQQLANEALRAMQQRNYDQAAELYEQAIQADPHFLPAYFGLSDALRRNGNPEGSLAALEQAAANNPDSPAPLQHLGETQLMLDQPQAALDSFEKALEITPDNPTLHAEKGIALLMLGQEDAAKEAIDSALALDPLSPEARLANAAYLIKQREFRPATMILRELSHDRRAPQFVQERARAMLDKLQQTDN